MAEMGATRSPLDEKGVGVLMGALVVGFQALERPKTRTRGKPRVDIAAASPAVSYKNKIVALIKLEYEHTQFLPRNDDSMQLVAVVGMALSLALTCRLPQNFGQPTHC